MFFEASPDSTLAATDRAAQEVADKLTAFPEADFVWSLTAAWGGFGGMVAKDWKERERSTADMYDDVYDAVSEVPGLRVFPRLDPPLPTPGQYDVELIVQNTGSIEEANIGRPMSPTELNNKGIFNWNALMGTHLNDQAKFEKEPERSALTQPPAGYQTPSSAYPYGAGGDKGRYWTIPNILDRPVGPDR